VLVYVHAAALREHGIGLILDAVPNHMGIADGHRPESGS
jgi:maltooligosyltrehalose synthase